MYAHFVKQKIRIALARNVRALMDLEKLKQPQLAARVNVSQKTVSNVLNQNSEHAPTLDTLEQIARVFKIDVWQLLVPALHSHLHKRAALKKLLANYMESTDEGKHAIETMAQREREYAATKAGSTAAKDLSSVNGEAP